MASHQSQGGHPEALRTAIAMVRALVAMNPHLKGAHGALQNAHRRIDAFADSLTLEQRERYRDKTSAHEGRAVAEEMRGTMGAGEGSQKESRFSICHGGSVPINDGTRKAMSNKAPTTYSSPAESVSSLTPSPESALDTRTPPTTRSATGEGSDDGSRPSLLKERTISDDNDKAGSMVTQIPPLDTCPKPIILSLFPAADDASNTHTPQDSRRADPRFSPPNLRRSLRFPKRNLDRQTTAQATNGASPALRPQRQPQSKTKTKPPSLPPRLSSTINTFTVAWRDMGEALVPRLDKFFKDPNFSGKVNVSGIPGFDWAAMGDNVPPDENGNRDYVAVSYRRGQATKPGAYVTLRPVAKRGKRGRELRWPDFPLDGEVKRLTTKEMEDFLEDLVANPPAEPIPYYGGQPPPELCGALCAGDVFRSEQVIRFVSTPYLHAGYPRSATAIHVENAHWRSSNLTFRGTKIWLLINTEDTAKFESWIRGNWRHTICHDFVRHINIMMAPSFLTEAGIRFELFCALPGDLVLTEPYQYHYCVNYTACLAVSINFLLPNEEFLPESLSVCKGCGPYGLHEEYDSVKAVSTVLHGPGLPEERPPNGVKRRAGTKSAAASGERGSKRLKTMPGQG